MRRSILASIRRRAATYVTPYFDESCPTGDPRTVATLKVVAKLSRDSWGGVLDVILTNDTVARLCHVRADREYAHHPHATKRRRTGDARGPVRRAANRRDDLSPSQGRSGGGGQGMRLRRAGDQVDGQDEGQQVSR